jgi:hypothetical protein
MSQLPLIIVILSKSLCRRLLLATTTAPIPAHSTRIHFIGHRSHHLLPCCQLFFQNRTISAPPRVIIHTILVSHLAPGVAPPKLPPLDKSPIEIYSYGPVVQRGAVDVFDAVFCVGAGVIDHKSKAARRHALAVEPHDYALKVPCLGEDLVDLVFGGEKG